MATQPDMPASVTRTYRSALRLGDDYITLEETITLPLDASDEDIQRAVELGWRIYQEQHEAHRAQVAALRAEYGTTPAMTIRDPEAPASEKQRNYIANLQHDLHWDDDQLAAYAGAQGVHLLHLTKGQASGFIDGLKRLAEEQQPYQPAAVDDDLTASDEPREARPITERQQQALLKLAQGRGVDLESEAQQRFGLGLAELSSQQASELITELQRH